MLLYRDKKNEGSFRYFQAKYPILATTKLLLTQDNEIDEITKWGSYNPTEDVIILLDDPRLDLYYDNILAHEIAHVINYKVNGEIGHDKNWKDICNNIYIMSGILPIMTTLKDADWFAGGYLPMRPNLNKLTTPIDILPNDDDTLVYIKRHKNRVMYWMTNFALHLLERAAAHDNSKLQEPELSMWRKMDEEPRYHYSNDPESQYQKKLQRHQQVFIEHWSHNRHHPEFYNYNPTDFGLDVLDLAEFICDQMLGYKTSLGYNQAKVALQNAQDRYKFPKEVYQVIENTVRNHFAVVGGATTRHDTLYEKYMEPDYGELAQFEDFSYHIDILA